MTIEDQIRQITQQLDGDDRATRDESGRELPIAASIRAERSTLKLQRRALRHALLLAGVEAEAATPPRAIPVIEAELASLDVMRRQVTAQMRVLQRERDRALMVVDLAGMSDSKKAALRVALGISPDGVKSGEGVGSPR